MDVIFHYIHKFHPYSKRGDYTGHIYLRAGNLRATLEFCTLQWELLNVRLFINRLFPSILGYIQKITPRTDGKFLNKKLASSLLAEMKKKNVK